MSIMFIKHIVNTIRTHTKHINMEQLEADIALIGLAVMGQNIILNMNDHGFVVSSFR